VRPGSASNFSPNKIINSIINGTERRPPRSGGSPSARARSSSRRANRETGKNRRVEVDVTQEFPTNLFQITNPELAKAAGSGRRGRGSPPATPVLPRAGSRFTTYYVGQCGQGTVEHGQLRRGRDRVGTNISTPGW
jgi:hypothetical protein